MINKSSIMVLLLGQLIKQLFRWLLLIASIALLVGTSVAFFLWSLDKVTAVRWQYTWLIFLLPFAGIGVVFLYKTLGKRLEKGNNLLIEEVHQSTNAVPLGMAPLILVTTLLTHLFGGSAGREGTAVQMGGSIAAQLSKWFKLQAPMHKIVLLMGMSAGFGAVFGTPIAATIFALEVLAIGKIKYDALLPCLLTAIVADITCAAWGIEHTKYIVQNYYTNAG
ncbi:MAG: chloride channel protein, partial [Chitinophagaceae bacterium]